MEKWQKQFIDENIPELITSIRCDVVLLAYLVKYGALSPTDTDYLNSIQGGEIKKASALMSILQKQTGGYEHLTNALQKCTQTGAFSILLTGIQKHGLFRDVFFDGVRLPLKDISKSIDPDMLQNIIASELTTETYEEFLNPEPWTLSSETLPKEIKYYISRTLSINNEIDPEIFQKLDNDIFCIEDIEMYQLSALASRKGKQNSADITNQADMSRNQIHCVTTRFIHLERQDHFQEIAEKAENPVHWLKYNEGKYWYVKSNPGREVRKVSKFLVTNCEIKRTEDEFIERCANGQRNEPVFIYDSPGMGKSMLLAKLARKMKEKRPEDSVIHFEISDLIQKVRLLNESCSCAAVKQTLVNDTTENGLGRRIMGNLLDSGSHQIQLFLDGYDEVLQRDWSDAHKMLDNLVKEGVNIRVFVATRPHRRNELEEKFGVLGYNILPFDSSNKLSFFLKYWQNEHGVEITDEIKQYAEYCIKTVSLKLYSEMGDIAGIPLQCRMLAEIYAEYVKRGGLTPADSQFQLNSIFQVYKHFVDTKFDRFCTEQEKQMCYDFHVRASLRTLFPEKCKHFHEDLPLPKDDLIYRIGIMEPLKFDSATPGFSHRTLAEFFAAEFLATSATLRFHTKLLQSEFVDLFFQEALLWSTDDMGEAKFQHSVVCRFLNFFLSLPHSDIRDVGDVKRALRESYFYYSRSLLGLLGSSLMINAVHLYLFLLDLYLDLDDVNYKTASFLRFRENHKDTEMKEKRKIDLVNDLKNEPNFQKLLVTAVRYSSLNLVKLSCEFLESLTDKKFYEIPYNNDEIPMLCALKRGHYQIFEYLLSFDKDGFYEEPLLHWCLEGTANATNVGDKEQIVKMILNERPDLLNKPHPVYKFVPLLEHGIAFVLIKCLIEAGADLSQTDGNKENIAHKAAGYFSAEEYHEFVQLLVTRDGQMVFKQRDNEGLKPVHEALFRIDLKSETLELLANRCNINFNDNSPKLGSELAIAIENERSKRVIKDIIRLGGNRMKLYKWYRLGRWYNSIFK